ncbi:EF-P 5-aminopentanol modification-associated protein YfmF [Enterococcus alcedinis]|uniref:Peptidase M16 n=1 Tax=Enterococcus alcedinis TaxID=1274384 RepID=A0A917JGQ3_9ENTE|nr:pitrilysin family protein [Enterococcus alcedinis]MBP2102879.1 putative Zn-dependent peptidase [Enterococcus alcedinis]GGI66459.1 peptidase M16 [Enterococcus alcedinis]
MTIQIQPGVTLTVIPTEKYKTIRLFARFSAKHTQKDAASRTLLTSILETNSLNYPTQTALSAKLADLYGASFGLNVGKRGNLHQVNLSMTVVNGKYIEQASVFSEAVAFLKEILFYPNIQDGQFEQQTFDLEKNNLIAYIESIQEDKQSLASLKLQELFFNDDEDQKTPSFGRVEELKDVTTQSLVQTYQKMLEEDQIDLFVVGDVTEAAVLKEIEQLPFARTQRVAPSMFYRQLSKSTIQEETMTENVLQGKLNLGYATNIYYDDPKRYALMVFNGLFGGFPHSKLFMNVREKESLAYYASSSADTFRGFLSVQTGIDGKNREAAMALIREQLAALGRGEVTEEELAKTKAMLKNQYLLSLDNPQALIETAYLDTWLPETKQNQEELIEKIMRVTKEEVQAVAQQIQLESIFFLNGEQNDE